METHLTKKIQGCKTVLYFLFFVVLAPLVICSYLWELSLNTMSFQFKVVWANRHFEE
jgi:hypothetical protein